MVDLDALGKEALLKAGKAKLKSELQSTFSENDEVKDENPRNWKLIIAGIVGIGLLGIVALFWLWSVVQWVALAGGLFLVGAVGVALLKPKFQAKLEARRAEKEEIKLLKEAEAQKETLAEQKIKAAQTKEQALEAQLAALRQKMD